MEKSLHPTHGKTGLAHHATTVALTPARALTSHVRRRYREKYIGKYQSFRLVFAFDLFLLGVAAAFVLFDLVLLLQSVQRTEPGIRVSLHAPPLRASDTVPVEATIRVTDAKPHEDVSLRWRLPAWVEILEAKPAMEKNGSVFFGSMRPGQEVASRLLVRIKSVPGTKLPFEFSLRQFGVFGFPRVDVGLEERIVQTGVLRVFPAVDAQQIVSGGSLPLVLANDGSATATLLTLRVSAHEGAPDAKFGGGDRSLFLRDLAPRERRIIFLDVGETVAQKVHLVWELQDGAQLVDAEERELLVVPAGRIRINEPLRWVRGSAEAIVSVRHATQDAQLFVFHPMLRTSIGPFQIISLPTGDHRISIPLTMNATTGTMTEWSVVPVDSLGDKMVFGKRSRGRLASTFPFQVEARYYTALGDQIGVGPLPPRVGEKTSFWIVWSIGPTDADLSQVSVQTSLPENVRASGKFASSAHGTFQTDGKNSIWSIPTLPATGGARVTGAFEIELTPSLYNKGRVAPLIEESVAEAFDAQSGERLEAFAVGETTELLRDTKGKNEGIIR